MSVLGVDGLPVGECTRDPERWITTVDEAAKSICRMCPRRWACARDAAELPNPEGLWAGIVIPDSGRGRSHALRQLRQLAETNGYPVRAKRIFREPVAKPPQGDCSAGAERNTPSHIRGYTGPAVSDMPRVPTKFVA
jgi:WhiB family redox-sensing transcriptional regulator